MPTHPLADALQTAVQPYARLTQANLALFTELWFAPETLAQAYANTQRLFTPGASTSTNGSADLISRFTKRLMENYSRFFGELLQASMTAWSPAPYRLGSDTPPGGLAGSTGSTANLPVPSPA